ncbi:DUF2325 domain-containing protein [Candidatus Thiosymbion oneisti]|uniref:DUF2325 domain-containing protein n=1 Tax=Candidatus Thiosymbion oneisti TaxID=589554 RepID=UPI00105E927F|nr:DUF2325 domain-containing protein [Candidatus Thiosymbion oneisti]
MHRLLFEVEQSPPRLAVYDADNQRLLIEVEGEACMQLLALQGGSADDPQQTAEEVISALDAVWKGGKEATLFESQHPDDEPPSKPGRRKLWDLPGKFHCQIIGTCLEVSELRRIAAKGGHSSEQPISDYGVHSSFVAAAEGKNSLSIGAHKALEKKYAAHVRHFTKAKEEAAVIAMWQTALAEGQAPGAFWALMTHPKSGERAISLAYEDMHMLSHQIGTGRHVDLEALTEVRGELRALRARYEETVRRTHLQLEDKARRIQVLQERLSETEGSQAQLDDAQTRLRTLESGQELADLRQRVERLEPALADADHRHAQARVQIREWQERYHGLETRTRQLEVALAERSAECLAMENLLLREIAPDCEDCDSASCANCPDLAERQILCIGGRSNLAEHYRALVDRFNGRFMHHDGGMEDNRRRLDAMLATADAVVCPTDCVSHNAYSRAKRLCKRQGKPCILLPSSGISSFARALEQVAGREYQEQPAH